MRLVIAETEMLIDLHHRKMIQNLFSTGHSFHVVDIVAEQLGSEFRDLLLAEGLSGSSLSGSEMSLAVEIFRAMPWICVGEAASLAVAEARGFALLGGSQALRELQRSHQCGTLDQAWILSEIECVAPVNASIPASTTRAEST